MESAFFLLVLQLVNFGLTAYLAGVALFATNSDRERRSLRVASVVLLLFTIAGLALTWRLISTPLDFAVFAGPPAASALCVFVIFLRTQKLSNPSFQRTATRPLN